MDKEKIYHFLITPGIPIIIIFNECGNIRGVEARVVGQVVCNAARRHCRVLFCQNLCPPIIYAPEYIWSRGVEKKVNILKGFFLKDFHPLFTPVNIFGPGV